jgi:hypothetical protein
LELNFSFEKSSLQEEPEQGRNDTAALAEATALRTEHANLATLAEQLLTKYCAVSAATSLATLLQQPTLGNDSAQVRTTL